MASKNHHRYKLRKRMNSIKHEEKSLFNEPPLVISSWEALDKLENDQYYLDITPEDCNGWLRPKIESSEENYWLHNHYLSTHTFYESEYFRTTSLLRRLGFNVQLVNWDGETLYCR
jgi:hypothetical protein